MSPDSTSALHADTAASRFRMLAIALLVASNVFMTVAWYGHLKIRDGAMPMWQIVLASWGIAFFEYCLQVPANRLGEKTFSLVQLKVIQEVVSLLVFSAFAVVVFQVKLGWNHLAAFALITAAVFLVRT